MATRERIHGWTRRQFLRGASFFGVGGVAGALAGRTSRAATAPARGRPVTPPPYDIEKFLKVDPALVHYEASGTIRSPHGEPNRIAFSPDELLWISSGKKVAAVDRQGAKVTEFATDEEVRCLALARDGAVFVGLRSEIQVCDRPGKRLARWESPLKKSWFVSIAVTEKDVFAADAGNRAVLHFDRDGKLLGRIGEKDKLRNIPAYLVPSPYFDLKIGDGLLWVVNPGLHQLQAFTFDGELKKTWGEASFGIGGFCGCCNPSYFARLADGRFVTSEKGLPRIKIYSSDGKFESVVAGPDSFPKYVENLNSNPVAMDVAADSAGRIYVADTLAGEIRIYKRKG